jgi:hypothetical protein
MSAHYSAAASRPRGQNKRTGAATGMTEPNMAAIKTDPTDTQMDAKAPTKRAVSAA